MRLSGDPRSLHRRPGPGRGRSPPRGQDPHRGGHRRDHRRGNRVHGRLPGPPGTPRPRRASGGRPRPGGREAPPGNAAITAEHLTKTYRMGKVAVAGARRRLAGDRRRRDGVHHGPERLGQVDPAAAARPDRPADRRADLAARAGGDRALRSGSARGLRLRGLGYVFQEYALLPELTAAENVYLPAMMLGQPGRALPRPGRRAAGPGRARRRGPRTGPRSSPAASSSGSRSRGRW